MTHAEMILDLLRDGRWHTASELYALHVIAHSRIAELRRKGHVIEHRQVGRGSAGHEYRLLTVQP